MRLPKSRRDQRTAMWWPSMLRFTPPLKSWRQCRKWSPVWNVLWRLCLTGLAFQRTRNKIPRHRGENNDWSKCVWLYSSRQTFCVNILILIFNIISTVMYMCGRNRTVTFILLLPVFHFTAHFSHCLFCTFSVLAKKTKGPKSNLSPCFFLLLKFTKCWFQRVCLAWCHACWTGG